MSENKYTVNEIFESIDGEGLRAGSLAIFIRLAGCNLHCDYCDTVYALNASQGKKMSALEILEELSAYKTKHITLTGGEPLIQPQILELINALTKSGYEINIETNGSINVAPYQQGKTIITMDYKTPESGMKEFMRPENISQLRENDVLKFVCGKSDLDTVSAVLHQYKPNCWVYLSPVFGEIEPAELVNFLKSYDGDTEKMRVQVQLHKVIWNPDKRGV